MLGLARTCFDHTKAQASASAFVGKEKADGPGAYDQDVSVQRGIVHGFLHENFVTKGVLLPDWIAASRE
jgi:hypothetical protein